jgi:hypothetical protein
MVVRLLKSLRVLKKCSYDKINPIKSWFESSNTFIHGKRKLSMLQKNSSRGFKFSVSFKNVHDMKEKVHTVQNKLSATSKKIIRKKNVC